MTATMRRRRKGCFRQQIHFLFLVLVLVASHAQVQGVVREEQEERPSGSLRAEAAVDNHAVEESSENAFNLAMDDDDNHHHHDHHDHHHDHDKDDSNEFCHGSFMTMFMDGFRFSLTKSSTSHHHNHNHNNDNHNSTNPSNSNHLPPCLVYYVKTWKLNQRGKFRGAMVFSFLVALLTEGLSAARFVMIDYIHLAGFGHRHRKLILTIVYALQQWLGTMIMLISMMYSIEMLFSVIAGLMAGNYLFLRDHPRGPKQNNNSHRGPGSVPYYDNNPAAANMVSRRVAGGEEERQGLLSSCCNSDGGDSISGLQMQTRKED